MTITFLKLKFRDRLKPLFSVSDETENEYSIFFSISVETEIETFGKDPKQSYKWQQFGSGTGFPEKQAVDRDHRHKVWTALSVVVRVVEKSEEDRT